ncbi:MAG: arsenical efflux pump membrane protein ArsB, partial [Alicyclobacillus sp.]|nr:arsenical efflux pump membrane protein ArsB [Alicyclobacillus sp.]
VKAAPWSIVTFSLGMYIVVFGLHNVGLTGMLGRLIQGTTHNGLFVATLTTGFLAAGLSSIMNNLPTVMVDALAIYGTHTGGTLQQALVCANVIGCDLGPKMTPIGSLATLLWLHVLNRRGVLITWRNYCKAGLVLTVPTLLVTLTGLCLWIWLKNWIIT